MADEPHTRDGARALRDFFSASNAADLKRAAGLVANHFHLPLGADIDWTGVEYDFNRLFVGPMAVPAPPYASAYRTDPSLMGGPAMEARDAYRALGLMAPDQGRTPDDHLAFELDLAAALLGAAGAARTDPALAEVRAWLFGEHLPDWIPAFAGAVESQSGVSAPVAMAVSALKTWLETTRSLARTGDA